LNKGGARSGTFEVTKREEGSEAFRDGLGWVESNSKSQRNFSISEEQESAGIAINKHSILNNVKKGIFVNLERD
jgi:hypothetical protein